MDHRMRRLERDAAAGDREARIRRERQLCRMNRHSWNAYKGGPRTCRACGTTQKPRRRELGAMTLYGTAHMQALMASYAEELEF